MWNQSPRGRSDYGECPVCHGAGWELYEEVVRGYSDAPVVFAKECSYCSRKRREFDITGTPREFYNAQYSQFNFGIYSNADMSKLQKLCDSMVKDFETWEKDGKGLYLWSNEPGSGKTFLACCIAKTVMMQNDAQMRFVTEPDYLASVQEGYRRERGLSDPSEAYRTCRLLVLDDLGTQKDGDWMPQEMFRLINTMANNRLVTIYTSNNSTDTLKFNSRTVNRIEKSSIILHMPEESIRKKEAREEQARFAAKILR